MQDSTENLIKLTGKGESQTLEFKESFAQQEKILETICAFANTNRGTVLVGVSDKGEVTGTVVGKDTLEKIPQKIKENFDPCVFPSINVEEAEGKKVVAIEVREFGEKPVFFRDAAYKRVGRANRKISASEIRKLAKESGEKVYWDEMVCRGATLKEIDEDKVRWFLKEAKRKRDFDVDPDTPLKEALERLSLIKDEKLANAAILLFGKDPQKFFLQARIRCARFKGITEVDFLDMKIIDGNVIDQVDDAEKFILSHIKKAAKVVMFKREEVWEYPPDALREAIANAVAHRDYGYPGNIKVAVFDDRIEITDPGKLPEPITPELLKQKHDSVPRNKLVSEVFFLIKNIEQWGKGTNKMVGWCIEHGLKEPDFKEIGGGFMVKFHAPKDVLKLIPEKAGVVDLKELGLNERQIEALGLMLNENITFTNKDYRERFKVSNQTCVRDMRLMSKLNLVIIEGQGKNSRYKAR